MIQDLIQERLSDVKKREGKRFSTNYEGHARVAVEFDSVTHELGVIAQGIELLWSDLKAKKVGEDYKNTLGTMSLHAEHVVSDALELAAQIEKLRGGVIHEIRE
jgi:hypothetical protein